MRLSLKKGAQKKIVQYMYRLTIHWFLLFIVPGFGELVTFGKEKDKIECLLTYKKIVPSPNNTRPRFFTGRNNSTSICKEG